MSIAIFSLRATTRKSVADVTRRRGRTILVVLGILIGILGLTAINVAGDTINSAFAYTNNTSASPDISFSVLSVDPTLATTLASVPNVQTVQIDTLYQTRWHVSAAPGHVNMNIVGYQDFQQVKLNPFQLTAGRLPGNGEIVMEESNRQQQAVAVGDTVTIDTPHGPEQLRVVGFARTLGLPGPVLTGSTQAYMSTNALSQVTGNAAANDIEIKVYDKNKDNEAARAIASVLHTQQVTVLNASIAQSSPGQSVSNSLLAIMRILSIIALVLTSFLIINTVTTLVSEQTKIIGTMKAVGGTRQAVMRGYLFSIALYSIIGTVPGIGLGIFCGYFLASFMLNLFTIDPGTLQIAPTVIITSIVVGLAVPLAAAIIPLWSGTKITVREAMAAYGVNNRNVSRSGIGQRMVRVPQTTWLGVRGIFRKRGRAILTLLALTLSGTAFLAIQTTTYSFDQVVTHLSSTYNYDAWVTLATPQPYVKVRSTVLSASNVARVERFETNTVNTKYGVLVLTGTETDPHLYVRHLIAGRWFTANEANVIVISNIAASKSGLKVGDMLTFSNATKTVSWRIIGEVDDPNDPLNLGTGLTPVNDYYSFEGLPTNLVQGFMVEGTNRSPQAVDTMASHLDATLSRMGAVPGIETAQENMARNQGEFAIVDALFYAVGVIVALVGVLGLFNTLTTSVLERRREIGILRSMGATNWRIASVFWLEGIALAAIAWLVGVILGFPAAYGFVTLLGAVFIQVPFAFNPLMLLYMLGFIIVLATLASCIPVLSATRVRIADTLRYE